ELHLQGVDNFAKLAQLITARRSSKSGPIADPEIADSGLEHRHRIHKRSIRTDVRHVTQFTNQIQPRHPSTRPSPLHSPSLYSQRVAPVLQIAALNDH